jgi:hypothetical protein
MQGRNILDGVVVLHRCLSYILKNWMGLFYS